MKNESPITNHESHLNTEQQSAVDAAAKGGAVLILAGAGTGKTTALIASIISVMPVPYPHDILAVTFTNKAAKEMKDRIYAARGATPYWCGTFHSVCLKILRREYAKIGRRADFIVLGEDEQKKVVKSVIAEMELDSKDFDAGRWVEIIAFYKDTGRRNHNDKFDEILHRYNAELARLNAMDFADIINHTNNLFIENPTVLKEYQNKFRYIFVDEFQDTNPPQYTLIRMLGTGHGNICVVGDDDQSIYSWRGAEIKNILGFDKDFGGAQIFRMTQNYRSTGNILGAANSLIKNNTGRLGKDLWSDKGAGDAITVAEFISDFAESAAIADEIENNTDIKKSDFTILIRNGSLSKKFEDEFISRGIPYRLIGSQKFYDRMEIQDAICYLRLLVHRFDDMAFMRIIGRPRRGLGDVAIQKLATFARAKKLSLFDALSEMEFSGRQKQAVKEFIAAFDFNWESMEPADAAMKIIEDSGYLKSWEESKDKDDTAVDRIKNIYELVKGTIARYDSLAEFLESASLMVADDDGVQNEDTKDAVNIMTIHAAKGLEFDTVFMPAWEDGIFPNEKSIMDGSLEEERRLAYVAITRARRRAVISHAETRMVFGQIRANNPSMFIDEIDESFIETRSSKSEVRAQQNKKRASNFDPRVSKKSMVGKLVSHNELGSGVVIEDSGTDIVTVAFRNIGIKKVDKRFLT